MDFLGQLLPMQKRMLRKGPGREGWGREAGLRDPPLCTWLRGPWVSPRSTAHCQVWGRQGMQGQ